MDLAQLISSHFNVFMGLVTLLATVFIAAVAYITGRWLVLRIRKYIIKAEEISKEKELEHKRLEWKRDYVNNFIVEPLVEYLEEGTEIINSLFTYYKRDKYVGELSNSGSQEDSIELMHREIGAEEFQRLGNFHDKDTMAQARAKFLEDPKLTKTVGRFTLYVAKAGQACHNSDEDGLMDASQQAMKCATTALKRLSKHQDRL